MSNGMIYKNTCYSIGTEQIVNTKKVGFLFSNMNIAFNIHFKQHTIGQVLYHYIPLIINTTKNITTHYGKKNTCNFTYGDSRE